jgi:hypothetical protein
MELFVELFFILLGLCTILFHSRIVAIGIDCWYAMYPNKKVSRRGLRIIFLGAGILFVIFGLAGIFGFIKIEG